MAARNTKLTAADKIKLKREKNKRQKKSPWNGMFTLGAVWRKANWELLSPLVDVFVVGIVKSIYSANN